MSEIKMTEENKKTITAFVAGLLVGGLLVFIFANPTASTTSESPENVEGENMEMTSDGDVVSDSDEDSTSAMESVEAEASVVSVNLSDASVEVSNQAAGEVVVLDDITFPSEAGWVGIRDYQNDQLVGLLGVARWNKAEGLSPSMVPLLRGTIAGETYAVVFYSDNGDKEFNLADDAQTGGVIATFTAE